MCLTKGVTNDIIVLYGQFELHNWWWWYCDVYFWAAIFIFSETKPRAPRFSGSDELYTKEVSRWLWYLLILIKFLILRTKNNFFCHMFMLICPKKIHQRIYCILKHLFRKNLSSDSCFFLSKEPQCNINMSSTSIHCVVCCNVLIHFVDITYSARNV